MPLRERRPMVFWKMILQVLLNQPSTFHAPCHLFASHPRFFKPFFIHSNLPFTLLPQRSLGSVTLEKAFSLSSFSTCPELVTPALSEICSGNPAICPHYCPAGIAIMEHGPHPQHSIDFQVNQINSRSRRRSKRRFWE